MEERTSESEVVFEAAVDRRGFVILPNVVLMDPTLSAEARLMYALFVHYARQKGYAYPGMKRLAKVLGVSQRSATTYRRELEKAKLLSSERRSQKSNLYTLLDLDRRVARIREETRERELAAAERDRQKTTRQKREPDRQKTTVHDRQQTTLEVDGGEGDAGKRVRAPARVKIGGVVVAKKRWENTGLILAEYNRQAGSKYRVLTSGKQPSQAAQRIYKVLKAYPDITLDEHADIIRRTLASHWWGSNKPTPSVVYGMGVFEDNITRDPTVEVKAGPKEEATTGRSKQERLAAGIEAIKKLRGEA